MNLQDLMQNQVLIGLSGATVIGGAMYLFRQFPKILWQMFLDQFSISLESKNTDASFFWLISWLAKHPYSERARNLSISSVRDGVGVESNDDNKEVTPRYILSPGAGFHVLMIGKRPAFLTRGTSEKGQGNREVETLTLRVFGRDRKAINAVVDGAVKHVTAEAKKTVHVHMHRNDYWYVGIQQPLRDINSVILADGVMETILDDVGNFFEQSAWYAERGIPWRRGYKLFGPPGCGKSSLVSGIASHFGMSVALLNLSGISDDGELVYLLRSQPHNSILLIEDIDAAFKDRSAKDAKITFSSFLNAIDGLAAPNGRILFMTTNHPELLDPALVRPGRIDFPVEIGAATVNQAARMYQRFFGDEHTAHAQPFGHAMAGVRPAEIQKLMMEHRNSPETALRVVSSRLHSVA